MRILENCRVPLCVIPEAERAGLPVMDAKLDPLVAVCIEIRDGRVERLWPGPRATEVPGGHAVENLDGSVVTPRLVDAHVHLDKAHTWDRAPNRSATFAEAIETLGRDKENWTEEDLYRRANYAMACAYAHGTTAVRTHVDTGLPWAETSHRVMAALREEWKERILLQTVSLCGVDQYAGPEGAALADLPVRHGAVALGGMPLMNPELPRQLDAMLSLALDRQVGIDLHVDESGDAGALTLLAVAEAVLRNRFPYPVTCGHACSLAVQDEATTETVIRRVREAGIRIISLPLCNLYLQDRSAGRTPRWRGITLLNEWQRAGVLTACASDNVRDAFYAYGDLDAFEVLLAGIRIGHMDNDLLHAPELVTTAPGQIMGLAGHGWLAPGAPARLIAFAGRSFSEWLSRPTQSRRLFEYDRWLEPTVPPYPILSRHHEAEGAHPS